MGEFVTMIELLKFLGVSDELIEHNVDSPRMLKLIAEHEVGHIHYSDRIRRGLESESCDSIMPTTGDWEIWYNKLGGKDSEE